MRNIPHFAAVRAVLATVAAAVAVLFCITCAAADDSIADITYRARAPAGTGAPANDGASGTTYIAYTSVGALIAVDWMKAEGIYHDAPASGLQKIVITDNRIPVSSYTCYVRQEYIPAVYAIDGMTEHYSLDGESELRAVLSRVHVSARKNEDVSFTVTYPMAGNMTGTVAFYAEKAAADIFNAWDALNDYYRMEPGASQFSVVPSGDCVYSGVKYVKGTREYSVQVYIRPAQRDVLNALNGGASAHEKYAAAEPDAGTYEFGPVLYKDGSGAWRYAFAWRVSTDLSATPEVLRQVNDYFGYGDSTTPYSLYKETASYRKVTVYYYVLKYTVDNETAWTKQLTPPANGAKDTAYYRRVCAALGQADMRSTTYSLTQTTEQAIPVEVWVQTRDGICSDGPVLTVYVADNTGTVTGEAISRVFWIIEDGDKNYSYTVETRMTELYAAGLTVDQMTVGWKDGRLAVGNSLTDSEDGWNAIFDAMQSVAYGLSGMCALLCVVFLIINIIKFGASASNPAERARSLRGFVWSGICIAGCGSFATVFALAYSLI